MQVVAPTDQGTQHTYAEDAWLNTSFKHFRNLARFYKFCTNGLVTNPARSTVEYFMVTKDKDSGRIVAANSRNAFTTPSSVFVTNGCVFECNLIKPADTGSGYYQTRVKRIGIYVFEHELDAMKSFFAKIYGRKKFWTNFFNDVMYFTTQKESAVENARTGTYKYSDFHSRTLLIMIRYTIPQEAYGFLRA